MQTSTQTKILIGTASALLLAQTAGAAISFTAGQTLAAPQNPNATAAGDFNRDGRMDLATTVDAPDRVLVFFGTATGVFGAGVPVANLNGVGVRDILAADLDGDGDTDLIIGEHNINAVQPLINQGNGFFVPGATAPVGDDTRGMSMGDLDGDGDVDFAVANRGSDTVSIIRNTAGVLTTVATLTAAERPTSTAIADFDGDGIRDVAVGINRTGSLSVFRNLGNATFAAGQSFSTLGQGADGIAAGDLNGDGKPDLGVAVNSDTGGLNALLVLRNTSVIGAISFAGAQTFATGGIEPGSVAIGDLDADGRRDVATANKTSGNVSIFGNTSVGPAITFAAPTLFATGASPESVTIADLNGNGTPELIVANRDSSTLSVFINGVTPPRCPADLDNGSGTGTPDGGVTVEDLLYYLAVYESGGARADLDNGTGSGTPDGGVTIEDLLYFVGRYYTGC